ncbi:thiol-disulfide oxidoreductase DCC family protein [Bowmanella sp. JS7-9]|uniref:Thiol-disulfide oxidoreductase DCC family protein n=1 Tax=Pseudobowmanella zhangzhouensis TaxID=1537679 RepID=A0ABW1XN14_9ALTE|nr:DUF393 domain-containing protein [Bowmanella sp. JS7-9]TBX23650.1 hypothetical protein TK45_05935 [Bowmanella sp. JS7-9]
MPTESAALTLFYDGYCPLCVHEVTQLGKLCRDGQIAFVDIQTAHFASHFAHIDYQEANRILLGQRADGQILRGLDVTRYAWQLAGRGWLVAPLGWRWVRWLADPLYLWFARHRYRISGWLTGQQRCDNGQCRRD